MIGSDTPDFGANRSGVFVEEGEDRSTLTLYARNRLVSWVVSVLAVFLATGALSLAANGLRASDYLTAFVMVGVALAVVWLQSCRSTIIFLISAMALAGFRPLGQVLVQFMIVWQR
jgi:hypothetical protein